MQITCGVEAGCGRPGPARRIVQFRARGSAASAKSPCNQHHPVGQQRRRMKITCGVEAARECPGPAVQLQWRSNIRGSLADTLVTSLSQHAWHHLDNETRQNEKKRTPTETCHSGRVLCLFILRCPFLIFERSLKIWKLLLENI